MGHGFSPRTAGGFTLVELLVTSVILTLIMVVTMQITSRTQGIWQHTRSRIDAFEESRAGFESMTRHLSQATLNTYWDYVDASGNPRDPASSTFVPSKYVRQSELHFLSGPAKDVLQGVTGSNGQPLQSATDCVFFQAPLGLSESATSGTGSQVALPSVLNAAGYFLAFGDDAKFRPGFLANSHSSPLRNRSRLMEMTQPTESLGVYQSVAQAASTGTFNAETLHRWFVDPLNADALATATSGTGGSKRITRVLAENVIALIVLPKRSANDGSDATEIAPNYAYDSRLYQATPGNALAALSRNQLPPLVQVTMVAIDESSAARLENAASPSTPPDFGLASLFATSSNGSQLTADLATLEKTLNGNTRRATYRIFTTDVSILQSKWSEK